jgi:predicted RNA-binding protein YlxR (DUF448 family)
LGAGVQQQDQEEVVETASGSLRRCALSRAERSPDDLIRFVVDPSGSIVPDLARKLPGRGVWVTADMASVAAAAKTNAFAKSLKRQVSVPPDLPNSLDAFFVKRVVQALSLANKAGLVVSGFEKVETLLGSGKAGALLHGSDAAEDGQRKLDRKYTAICRDKGKVARIVDWLTIAQLSLAIGRSNVVHAGLKPGGATQTFLREAERLQRYRSGVNAS